MVKLHCWFRYCAISRKVTGSIPDGVTRIFYWFNPSSRIMALASTQPLLLLSALQLFVSFGLLNYFFPLLPLLHPVSNCSLPSSSNHSSHRLPILLLANSASNQNEYQGYLLGGKGGCGIGLTTLPLSYAYCLEIL